MLRFDPVYFLYIGPAVLLALWAQFRVKSTYAAAQRMPAPLSGAAAARHILDSAGLDQIEIEQIPGVLSDHYDPRAKVLRLSQGVYGSRSLAAVGIAAHEAGHALQDAAAYAPLVVRNAAVPAASLGSGLGMIGIMVGFGFGLQNLVWIGIALFSAVVIFQIVNLPVEFDASARAKRQLVGLGIIDTEQLRHVSSVLNAAALTYVAATLQAIMTLLYYVMRASGDRRD